MAVSHPASGPRPLRLQLSRGATALDAARRALTAHLQGLQPALGAPALFACELVFEEWVNNAFEHGGATRVAVQVDAGPDAIGLRFEDDGRPFDPTRAVPRELPRSLDEAEPGGLGLRWMRRHAFDWRYAREAGHNIVALRIAR